MCRGSIQIITGIFFAQHLLYHSEAGQIFFPERFKILRGKVILDFQSVFFILRETFPQLILTYKTRLDQAARNTHRNTLSQSFRISEIAKMQNSPVASQYDVRDPPKHMCGSLRDVSVISSQFIFCVFFFVVFVC